MVSVTQLVTQSVLLNNNMTLAEISTEEIGTPTDIRLIESSTTSLTIGWIVSVS